MVMLRDPESALNRVGLANGEVQRPPGQANGQSSGLGSMQDRRKLDFGKRGGW